MAASASYLSQSLLNIRAGGEVAVELLAGADEAFSIRYKKFHKTFIKMPSAPGSLSMQAEL